MSTLAPRLLLQYGLFGLPLAMVALPVYLYVPQFYAQQGALSLAAIGAALLATRIVAAFLDPVLGYWINRAQRSYTHYIHLSLPLLLLGVGMLFHPPRNAQLGWMLASLLLVYAGFGLASIAYQSWGAALANLPGERVRLTGVREGCAVLGVMLAAGLASSAGLDALIAAFAALLLACAALLPAGAPRHAAPQGQAGVGATVPNSATGRNLILHNLKALAAPLGEPRFRALFTVLLTSGMATAVPATLFLFFVADRLQLAERSGQFLIVYFCAAAVSMPLWAGLARQLGEARAWCASMLLAALVFCWAYTLAPGSAAAFFAICSLSGLALGADLALPPALLAAVIRRAGHAGQHEAAYFGIWNWGVQLSLALAAGIALPALQWLGYVPGASNDAGSGGHALALTYAVLPCVLKLIACAILWRAPLRDC
jgi:GPH family glycoside/pentoside/hexuronide:cation symporter